MRFSANRLAQRLKRSSNLAICGHKIINHFVRRHCQLSSSRLFLSCGGAGTQECNGYRYRWTTRAHVVLLRNHVSSLVRLISFRQTVWSVVSYMLCLFVILKELNAWILIRNDPCVGSGLPRCRRPLTRGGSLQDEDACMPWRSYVSGSYTNIKIKNRNKVIINGESILKRMRYAETL